MARHQQEALRTLSEAERAELERLSRSGSERVDRVRRDGRPTGVGALLAVVEGQSFVAAANRAGLGSSTVTALVRRCNQRRLGVLTIAAGRGRHPTYDAAARAKVVATAQRTPDRRPPTPVGRPCTATWSLSTLEPTVRREGLPAIGATTIRRVLHAAGSS
ncbi:MAG: helix-turn-helix domain-containing protein [Chloroflexota bacterium]